MKYDTTFPRFKKIDVNGEHAAPLYKWLRKEKGGLFGDAIKWNFTKFLVDRDGKVVARYAPTASLSKIEVMIKKLIEEYKIVPQK